MYLFIHLFIDLIYLFIHLFIYFLLIYLQANDNNDLTKEKTEQTKEQTQPKQNEAISVSKFNSTDDLDLVLEDGDKEK
jgi:hypothetical protein